MPFAVSCPECTAKLTSSKPIAAGRSLTCPKCKAKFVVGSSPDIEPESKEHQEPKRASPAEPRREVRENRPRERASRRDDNRNDRDDDDAPRRSRRDAFDEDERDDDFRDYPSRRTVPGKGMGVAGMIIGIIAVVIAFGSSGPYLCAFCCIFFLPFTLIISGIDTALSATGLILSIFARKAGNRGPMPMWGIVLNAIALFLSVAGIILSIVYGAAIVAASGPGNLPKTSDNDIPGMTKPGPGGKKLYEREEIRDLVDGSTEDGVVLVLGQPVSKTTRAGETIWTYHGVTRDPVTGKIDFGMEVVFRKGKVTRVNPLLLDPGRR